MKVSAIVYTSNTGFTAWYAQQLGQRTGLPVYPMKQAAGQLGAGSRVLYLGWLCAEKIQGLPKALGRFDVAAVCAVGMARTNIADVEQIAQQNKLKDKPVFYLRGGFNRKKLDPVHRLMIRIASHGLKRSPAGTPAAELLQAFRKGSDWTDAESLTPVQQWLEQDG